MTVGVTSSHPLRRLKVENTWKPATWKHRSHSRLARDLAEAGLQLGQTQSLKRVPGAFVSVAHVLSPRPARFAIVLHGPLTPDEPTDVTLTSRKPPSSSSRSWARRRSERDSPEGDERSDAVPQHVRGCPLPAGAHPHAVRIRGFGAVYYQANRESISVARPLQERGFKQVRMQNRHACFLDLGLKRPPLDSSEKE